MNNTQPPDESESPLTKKAENLRWNWFVNLPPTDRNRVVAKEFDSRYKTNEAKRKALTESSTNDIPF